MDVGAAGQCTRASLMHTCTYTKVAGLILERRSIHLSAGHTRTRFCRCCTWTSCRIWRRLSAIQASKSSCDDDASRGGCGGSRKARGSRCNPPRGRLHRRCPVACGSRCSQHRALPGGRDLAASPSVSHRSRHSRRLPPSPCVHPFSFSFLPLSPLSLRPLSLLLWMSRTPLAPEQAAAPHARSVDAAHASAHLPRAATVPRVARRPPACSRG